MKVPPAERVALAISRYEAGRLAEAEAYCWAILDNNINNAETSAEHLLALQILSAIQIMIGQPDVAFASVKQLLEIAPHHSSGHHNLGLLRARQGRYGEALAAFHKAIAIKVDGPKLHANRGKALHALARCDEALSAFDAALAVRPDYSEAEHGRGNALYALGRYDEAVAAFDKILASKPDHVDAHNNRGSALQELGRHEEAIAAFDQALALRAVNPEAQHNRGVALQALRHHDDALAAFDRALALKLDYAEALNSRGATLRRIGRYDQAIACYDRALDIRPDFHVAHSNKIFALDFVPDLTFAEHQEERRRWYDAHGKSVAMAPATHSNSADPSRPLVLGYVSAEFKNCSASSMFGPVLRRHDRERFRVIYYSGVRLEDNETRDFRRLADRWRPTLGLSDEALAAQIRADGIDILIDLTGHSQGNRLLTFARKPAPVQVTAWGYATGTGLPTVDYIFTDPLQVPAEVRHLFAEACFDLPSMAPFEAPPYAPAVAELPSQTSGTITFGCLNKMSKVSEQALGLWARILRSVPGSRLRLKDSALGDPTAQARIRDRLRHYGIAAERIELLGRTSRRDHLAAFHGVDIGLDPFPYCGSVGTWEALWMGVPVVTKVGKSIISRSSASILFAAGFADWIALDDDGYAALAIGLANDVETLAKLRRQMRARLASSPGCDLDRYTRAVEDGYRTMWRDWCAGRSSVD